MNDFGDNLITLYCPDCRGRFEVEETDIIEGECVECDLCQASVEIIQEHPIKVRLYDEDNYF